MLTVGSKLLGQRLLMKCAAALGLDHPYIIPIEDEDLIRVSGEIGDGVTDGVLKRTQSAWSYHLITKHTQNPRKEITTALEEQRDWKSPGHLFVEPRWFLQPYLPALMYLGELRTFLVDGALYYTIYTTPTEFDTQTIARTSGKFVRPLRAFGYVISAPNLFPSHSL